MGYDLRSKSGNMSLNVNTYGELLDLARAFGWAPIGANDGSPEKENENIDASYNGNNFQSVTEEDGENMARALERVIECLELMNRPAYRTLSKVMADPKAARLLRQYAGGPNKRMLEDFCTHIRDGFTIT